MTIQELHKEFIILGKQQKKILYKLQLLLPEIERLQVWKKYNCGSLPEYVAKYAGIGMDTLKKALSVGKKIEDKPVLKDAVLAVGVNKVAIALRLPGTDEDIAEKAMTLSKKALELLAGEKTPGVAAEQKMIVEFTPEMQKMFYVLKQKLNARTNQEAVILMMRELLNLKEKFGKAEVTGENSIKIEKNDDHKLEANCQKFDIKIVQVRNQNTDFSNLEGLNKKVAIQEKDFGIASPGTPETRYIKVQRKTQVMERSKGICEYSGCTKVAVEFHHDQPWSKEKSHKSLKHYCKEHHQIEHIIGSTVADFEYRQKRKEIICV